MSGQILELIIFAAIAFFIINKLISTLGKTSGDDPAKNNSFFGENIGSKLKDVTYSASTASILKPKFLKASKPNLKGVVLEENKEAVEKGLQEVLDKVPAFDIQRFANGAKLAFQMIVESALQNDEKQLEELVDKRYIDSFKTIASNYGNFNSTDNKLEAYISDIYLFGNNIFIKVLFTGNNITDKIKNLQEEWTFSKSTLSSDPTWYLTNIDRPQ
ncbi:MAG: Tim44/TimA family putative adaptor protein [Rickettsiaceae bacterium]|jgi:predicted lipid-binding transport protein (Tim44 family)|nr:Tim44/TimA family putative adaptor protein [Rickettsiaceae bacterium]